MMEGKARNTGEGDHELAGRMTNLGSPGTKSAKAGLRGNGQRGGARSKLKRTQKERNRGQKPAVLLGGVGGVPRTNKGVQPTRTQKKTST